MSNSYWDSIYRQTAFEPIKYDLWLDKHIAYLEPFKGVPILDLGCGAGNNTLYLTERGYRVIACDLSVEALRCVQAQVPEAQTMRVDLTEPLPFADGSVAVIVADLCLHYFSLEQTESIAKELARVLKPEGALLARVNSVRDVEYGAGRGELIEPNYYLWQDQKKRFFDRIQLEVLFQDWRVTHLEEQVLHRYDKPKVVWELAALKNT